MIAKLNNTPLQNGVLKYLFSIPKAFALFVAIHDSDKSNSGKQYIHDEDWFIPMNFDQYLMYVTIR